MIKTLLVMTVVFWGSDCFAGSLERARSISREYDLSDAKWRKDVRTAKTNDAMNAAWLRKPEPTKAGRLVWAEIKGSLSESWTLEPAAWLLSNATEYAIRIPKGRKKRSPAALIRDSVRKHHLKSSKVGPYCIAITNVKDPKSVQLLETIEKVNGNAAVKGAAALGQVILYRRLGQGGTGMATRQEKLKIAIKAPDLTVGKSTTQAIARDEIFRMTNLNLGTVSPDFRGIEVDQTISNLRDHLGKVTVLLFWHGLMPSHDETLELFRSYQKDFQEKGIELVGINMDNPLTLRRHIAEGNVSWKNYSDASQKISKLYRIENWPQVYVLDKEHKIRYIGGPGEFVRMTAEGLLK